jgi:phage-related protein
MVHMADGEEWSEKLRKSMGQGLWEVRTELPSNRIGRVLLCLDQGVLVALHAFIKKTQKTPADELALARKRQKELKS